MVAIADDVLWMVIVAFIIAFLLALGIGANDVANTFGTSVGAKVLTMRQACYLATVFETLGAVLLGAKVADTVRKGILNAEMYEGQDELFILGNLAALIGSTIWLAVATVIKMPVSGTHSIVGSMLGFTLVAKGLNGIGWVKLGLIVASWFISPIMAGLITLAVFVLIKKVVLDSANPLEAGLKLLPIFYGVTLVINVFAIFYDGPKMLLFHLIPIWGVLILAFGIGFITGLLVYFIMVPYQRTKINEYVASLNAEAPEIPTKPASNGVTWRKKGIANGCMNGDVHVVAHPLPTKTDVSIAKPAYDNPAVDVCGEGDQGLSTIGPNSYKHTPSPIEAGPIRRTISLEVKERRISREEQRRQSKEEEKERRRSQTEGKPKRRSYLREDSLNLPDNEPQKEKQQKVSVTVPADDAPNAGPAEIIEIEDAVKDSPETVKLFSYLQILTAIFGAFAHGGNDVSNAIGPVASVWLLATAAAADATTPLWVLLIGGVGISLGLWIWGRRVIETMGENLTEITPSSGFCIEIGAAFSVLVASNTGIPISSTHCKVGSIVFVGRYRSKENVDWGVFRNIVLAWVLTLPASGGLSALAMLALQEAAPAYNLTLDGNLTTSSPLYNLTTPAPLYNLTTPTSLFT